MKKATVTEVDGLGSITFARNKRAKRLSITVRPFKGVRVTVPAVASLAEARQFVSVKRDWIAHQLERVKPFEEEARLAAVRVAGIDRETADPFLKERLFELAALHGFTPEKVTIRCQKTRWGSCSWSNSISLNRQLILLPVELIDYVLLHELVHTRIKNHSPLFWAELMRLMPDARLRRALLKQYRLAE